MTSKAKQAGKRLSMVDLLMLTLVVAGLFNGGILAYRGSLLSGFLVATCFILAAAFIGELNWGNHGND